ncbi:uncharacterized protein [Henckelia pumila]|uniref:uncharacterized protein n=1 Tax=Henckelia pumila TaxID=405737 RepID=UPI003C6E2EE0
MISGESTEEEIPYNPDIERTLHRRRKEARWRQGEDERVVEVLRGAMADNANLSLRQLDTPDLNQQPLCITFPTLETNVTFELKSGLIHLLPSFHGLAGEDPQKNLMEFHVVCTSMKPHGVTEEQIQLRAFHLSLKNAAKDWLYYLPPRSITTWTEMKRIFLEKYFPASRAANIRKEIYDIKQFAGESLHENMLDAASGGVFVDKTPVQARNLIENMAANSQQFGTNRRSGQTVRACGVCAKVGHATDMCPTLQEGSAEQVGRIIPISDMETLQYTKCIIKLTEHRIILHHSILKFQSLETRASIQQLNTQMGQLATTVNRLEALNSSSLPSQTMVNPKENVSAITLRSGKELKGCKRVELGEQVSAVIQRKAPEKCKDPGPLTETAIVIQMADRSTIHPRGVLEDVFVQVGNLVFSADFYVLDMKNNDFNSPVLLGRPFLKTSKSIIDVNNGTLTMEFYGEIVKFHIFDTLKILGRESVVNNIDANDYLSQEHKIVVNEDKFKEVIEKPVKNYTAEIFLSDLQVPITKSKFPPDREKGMHKGKGRSSPNTGIRKISKQKKNRHKITAKLFRWVKVDKRTRYEPP